MTDERWIFSEARLSPLGILPMSRRRRFGIVCIEFAREIRVHPDDVPLFRRALIAHFRGETPRFAIDYCYQTDDGSWRWTRHRGIALRGADGRAYRMVGVTGDITETKQRERWVVCSRWEQGHDLLTSQVWTSSGKPQ